MKKITGLDYFAIFTWENINHPVDLPLSLVPSFPLLLGPSQNLNYDEARRDRLPEKLTRQRCNRCDLKFGVVECVVIIASI